MEDFRYEYCPLAQESEQVRMIRLLRLETCDDIVTLNLYPASLEDQPQYEAISYTWGDTKERKKINCNDQSVTVSENLHDALRYLRHADHARILWVDGICINQANSTEKSTQIRIMQHIYEAAQTVLVWIGRENDKSQRAFSQARRLVAAREALSTGNSNSAKSSTTKNPQEPFSDVSQDLFSVLQRDWFTRIWVIQEVSVCRKVMVVCGYNSIDWDDLGAALFAIALPGRVVDGPWNKTSRAIFEQRRVFDKTQRPHLSQLLVRHQDSLATNGEDKIYALLGLADELSQRQVTISYEIPINVIYQRVAVSCLAHDRDLSILGSVEGPSTSKLWLPSWVPDWSVPRAANALTFHDEFSSTRTRYTAARDSQYVWNQPKNKHGLRLSGFQFDCITLVGYADDHSVKANNFTRRQFLDIGCAKLRWQLSCERVAGVRSKNQKYVTGEDLLDAYWQTLCAGCTSDTFNTVRQEFLSFDEAMKSLSVLHKVNLSSSSLVVKFMFYCYYLQRFYFPHFGITPPLEWNGFTDRMVFLMGRRMARTSEGYIGLVPATTQPGDYVWLLEGGVVPFILRREGAMLRLVGGAYIHGIMEGEAFDTSKCESVEIV